MIDEHALLNKLSDIAKLGPVRSKFKGANAVGKMLQTLLGIDHSTIHRNRIFGYTVTATASSQSSTSRTNLFAATADWSVSRITSSKELAEQFGKPNLDKGYKSSLFCTMNASSANSFGLKLSVDFERSVLQERYVAFNDGSEEPILQWNTQRLEDKLQSLGHSAIVTAKRIKNNSEIYFQFSHVELLGAPRTERFLELISDDVITVDHCISVDIKTARAVEKGPLFKINSLSRQMLYSSSKKYDLLEL